MSPAISALPSSCTSSPIPSRPGRRGTLEDMLPRGGRKCCSKLQCGAFTGGSRDSLVLVFSVSVCSSFISPGSTRGGLIVDLQATMLDIRLCMRTTRSTTPSDSFCTRYDSFWFSETRIFLLRDELSIFSFLTTLGAQPTMLTTYVIYRRTLK